MNPRYTFETFVKGASNQFALAAALRVAETPGRSYNPLFIYGPAGLGKTHLLHAIGHYVQSHYQHDVVRYVSTETFLNEYIDAIRTDNMANFKRRYRDIDVLLIDDIQFMEGKEGLQEEFFHTFNSLHGANKQIVISSDRMPDAIPTLEERFLVDLVELFLQRLDVFGCERCEYIHRVRRAFRCQYTIARLGAVEQPQCIVSRGSALGAFFDLAQKPRVVRQLFRAMPCQQRVDARVELLLLQRLQIEIVVCHPGQQIVSLVVRHAHRTTGRQQQQRQQQRQQTEKRS